MDDDALSIPDRASDAEAAAIAAAVEAHLAAERAAVAALESSAKEDSWNGRRWAFAGRLEATGDRTLRVPMQAPTDPWTAAGRSERF
jgi:hypothetical protein